MITSTANARVKQAAALAKKAKYREETGLFVVEGPRMFQELPRERIFCAYVTERFLENPKNRAMTEGIRQVEKVSEDVLKAMSDTQTPQGVLALAKQCDYSLDEVLGGRSAGAGPAGETCEKHAPVLLMILEAVQDPGNLGTILRAGEGAGITGLIMDSKTADIYNPKVIRSTMGSVFRVPFLRTGNLAETLRQVKDRNIRLFAAHLQGSVDYDTADYTGDTGFLIGNEAAGLTDETAAAADFRVRIPMAGQVESLNAAVASSVLMFEAARQRRRHAEKV